MRDYYQILGVVRTATKEEIKKAYRQKMKEFHPDVNNDRRAHQQTVWLNTAYEVLMNDEKRRMYDSNSRPSYRTNANQTKEENPDSMYDWVKDVLATMMQELKDEARRVITIEQIVTIPLSYGLLGGQFHFTYFIYEHCPDCQDIHTCAVCNGAGRVPHLQDGVLITVECQECKGYGILTKQWCGHCDHGLIKVHQEYILNIKAGTQTNAFIIVDDIGGYKKGYINKCNIKFVYKFEQQYQNFVMQDQQLYYYHTISIDELYQSVIQLMNYNNEVLTLIIKRPLMITSNGLRFTVPNAGYYNELEEKCDDLIVILEILIP